MEWNLTTYVIIAYLAIVFFVGIFAGRYIRNFFDYVSGGGRLGIILLVGTVVATQWGGVTFLGIAGFAYENLYQGVWYALGPSIRFLFWAFLLAVVIRTISPYTVSEWFALRYDSKTGVLSSLLNVVTGLGLLGAQYVAFGAIGATFMGWDLTTGIIVGAAVVIIYTTVGGFFAVAATDTFQLVLAFLGGLIVIIASIARFGTMSEVRAELPASYFDAFEPWGVIFLVTIFMLWLSDLPLQYNIQRMIGAINVRTAYWAAIAGGLSYILVFYISPAVGAYARLAVPGLENPDQAYPELVLTILPNALAAVVAAALLAVLMSSADSYIMGPASLMMNDFYRVWRTNPSDRELMLVSRAFTVAFALVGLYAALQFQVIIDLILTFLVIGWAILPAYFASTMWRRASRHAAFWSMLVGASINAYLVTNPPAAFGDNPPYYTGWIGFGVALAILLVGSYLWPDRRFTIDQGDGYREGLNGVPPQ